MFLREKEDRRSAFLLDASKSILLIIDAQERFRGVVEHMEEVGHHIALLTKVAKRLGIPVIVSEQYPKALGATLAEISTELPEGTPVFSKLSFSAFDLPEWAEALRASKRNQFLLCGVEAHVCITQTALDLIQNLEGQVYLVDDAVSSRRPEDKEAGLRRLETHGAERVTSEMAVFEWLRKAGTPEFKELQSLIKSSK
jgi:nicotinamidase-related amidase